MKNYLYKVAAIAVGVLFGPPLLLIALAGSIFAIIGWFPTILAFCAGEWAWGGGMAVLWAVCVGALAAIPDQSESR